MWEGGAWDNSEVRSEMSVGEGQQVSQGHTDLCGRVVFVTQGTIKALMS